MNKVILMGRLTTTPELKTTASNISVSSFSIAVNRQFAKQGEERQADFINIVCWRQRAEFVCKYFTKGQLIALDGSLQTRQYQDNNGNTRYVTEVVADNVYFTGDKRNGSQENTNSYSNSNVAPIPNEPVQSYSNGSIGDFEESPLDDDLPF